MSSPATRSSQAQTQTLRPICLSHRYLGETEQKRQSLRCQFDAPALGEYACGAGGQTVRHTLRSPSGLGSNPGLTIIPHPRTLSPHPDTLCQLLLLYHGTQVLGRGGEEPAREASGQREPSDGPLCCPTQLPGPAALPTPQLNVARDLLFPSGLARAPPSILVTLTQQDPATPALSAPQLRLLPTPSPDLEAHCSVTSSRKPPDPTGTTPLNCPPEAP